MVRSRSQSNVKDIKSRRGRKGTLGRLLYIIYGAVIVLSLLAGLFIGEIYQGYHL